MKKLFSLVAVMMAMLVAMPQVNAQELSARQERQIEKEAKKKAKELTREGWKIDATRTLERALFSHLIKLENSNIQELSGEVTKTGANATLYAAQANALEIVSTLYASQAGKTVKGRATIDAGIANSTSGVESLSSFYSAYESAVEKEIKGELQFSYGLVKENKDGGFEYRAVYLIDEKAAHEARIRAFEQAAKESEAAQRYAEQISNFVRDGFKVEE